MFELTLKNSKFQNIKELFIHYSKANFFYQFNDTHPYQCLTYFIIYFERAFYNLYILESKIIKTEHLIF